MKTRNPYWDEVKGILILFVCMVHVLEPNGHDYAWENALYEWLQIFNMPLFIFIQGYFASHIKNDDIRLVKRTCFFVILFIICKVAYYGSYYIIHGKFQPWLLSGFWNEGSDPWFGLASAFFTVSIFFIRNLSAKILIPLSIISALLCGFDVSFDTHFSLMRIINFYPYFLLGFYADHSFLEKKLEKAQKKYIFVGIACLILIFTVFYEVFCRYPNWIFPCKQIFWASSNYVQMSATISSKFSFCLLRMLWLLSCYTGGGIILHLVHLIPPTFLKPFNCFGRKTLAIYFLHHPFIYALNYFFPLHSMNLDGKLWKFSLFFFYWVIAFMSCCIFSIPIFQSFLLGLKSVIDNFIERIVVGDKKEDVLYN